MKLTGALLVAWIGIAAFALYPTPTAAAMFGAVAFCYFGACILLAPETPRPGTEATLLPGRYPII